MNRTYTYDAENRLIAVDGGAVSYQYDASGRRVRKVVGGSATEYVLDLEGRVVQEYGPSSSLVRTEIFAGGQHLGTYRDGATYFSHTDWLGTERARTNMAGAVVETFTSLPFGDALSSPGSVSPLHFTGKERDAESGLDYFGARYYGSTIGRWLSPDWSVDPTPVPYADLGDPQSLNQYSYVRNNPLNREDTDGHCPAGDCPINVPKTLADVDRQNQANGEFLVGVGKGLVNLSTSMMNAFITMGESASTPIPQFQPTNDIQALGMVAGAVIGTLTSLGAEAPAASTIGQNATKGAAFEKAALEGEGLSKNTTGIRAVDPKTGQLGTTVPDALRANGQTVDVKNVRRLADSPQLRRQSEISARSGQKGQVIVPGRTQKISPSVTNRMEIKRVPDKP